MNGGSSPSSSVSRVSVREIMDLVRHSFAESHFLQIEAAIRSLAAERGRDERDAWLSREAVYKARILDLSEESRRKEAVCRSYVELKAAHADLEAEGRRRVEELAKEIESAQAVCEELLESKAASADLLESQRRELDALRREVEEKDELEKRNIEEMENLCGARFSDREGLLRRKDGEWEEMIKEKEVLCRRRDELEEACAELESSGKKDRSLIEELEKKLESRRAMCEELLTSKAASDYLLESRRRELDALRKEAEERDGVFLKLAKLEKDNGELRRVLEEREKLCEGYDQLKAAFSDLERLLRKKDGELEGMIKDKEELCRRRDELEEACAELESSGKRKIEVLTRKIEEKETACEKYVELKAAYIDVEDKMIAAEEEVKEWRRKYGKLEAWTLQMLAKDMRVKERISNKRNVKEERGIHGKDVIGDTGNVTLKSPKKEAVDVVMLSDSEEEDALCGSSYGGKDGIHNQMSTFCSVQALKSLELDQLHTEAASEDGTFEDDTLVIPTPKRKRAANVVVSESEEDEDGAPVGSVKTRRLQELFKVDRGEKIAQSEGLATKDLNDTGLCESASRSNRRLVHLRQCMEARGNEKEARGSTTSAKSPVNSKTDEVWRIHRKLDFEQAEIDDGVKVYGEVSNGDALSGTQAYSEGESLGGFIVDGSDNSEIKFITPTVSEESDRVCSSNVVSGMAGVRTNSQSNDDEEADSNLALNVLARTQRENKSFEWEYEADMLASFSKNPELCMKAVCALYRQQTMEEQSVRASVTVNRRGFNKLDAFRGSRIANFLLDGHPSSPVIKSIRDLRKYDSKGVKICHELAARYSKQLFTIYQNKEDPYFRSLK